MSGDFVIRRAVLGDRDAILGIAATGMREFGLEPDFHGLDADLGLFGEERPQLTRGGKGGWPDCTAARSLARRAARKQLRVAKLVSP